MGSICWVSLLGGPDYFTTEFKNWIKEDGNDYDDSANLEGKLYDIENGLNQFGY